MSALKKKMVKVGFSGYLKMSYYFTPLLKSDSNMKFAF